MNFIFCPYCKGNLELNNFVYTCNECKQKIYIDPKPTVCLIPIKDNKFLIAKRAQEPYKGEYDLIGGFINVNETIGDAAKRETKEETNLDIKIVKYLGSYPDIYNHDNDYTLQLTYIVEIVGGEMKAQDDISSLEWISIKDIKNLKLNGFKNTKKALDDLYDLFVGDE